jgi:hypothetical protein
MTGNSGAKFEFHDDLVVKYGGDSDLVEQYNLCLALGPEVCPRVFDAVAQSNSYSMERLVPGPDPSVDLLFTVFSMLMKKVWSRSAVSHAPNGWLDHIEKWCEENAPWIVNGIDTYDLYSNYQMENYCFTHGDPTLANVMRRRDGSGIVLIDPCPPRPGIPSLREVDVGKLLQSVAGWEGVPLAVPAQQVAEAAWDSTSGVELGLWRARCYFWAAVACARVVRHGTPSEAVRQWSRQASQSYAEMCGKEIENL